VRNNVQSTGVIPTNIMKASKDALILGYEYYLHYLENPLKVDGKVILKTK
jgi:hypothetical protein